MKKIVSAGILFLVFTAFRPAPFAPAAGGGEVLRYRFQPGRPWVYRLETEAVMALDMAGREIPGPLVLRLAGPVRLDFPAVKPDGSARVSVETGQLTLGVFLAGRTLPVTAGEGPPSLPVTVGPTGQRRPPPPDCPAAPFIALFLPRLPGVAAARGLAWTESSSLPVPDGSGRRGQGSFRARYTCAGTVETAHGPAVRIIFESEPPADIRGELFFAGGRLVSGRAAGTLETLVEAAAPGGASADLAGALEFAANFSLLDGRRGEGR